jgi:protein-disulfide isomerase
MSRWSSPHLVRTVVPVLCLGLALGCAHKAAHRVSAPPSKAEPAKVAGAAVAPQPATKDDATVVPVSDRDPSWGNPLAPVTIVEFSDFQCPFCGRVGRTLDELRRLYGPENLRFVWKNCPLPFHGNARPAAEAATTVFRLGGAEAFWKFHDLVFANQRALDPGNFRAWAEQAGVAGSAFEAAYAARADAAKVDDDIALADRLGIRGTPVFRINGVPVLGAQPIGQFMEIIEAQLAMAQELVAAGTPASALYASLSVRNAAALLAEQQQAEDAPEPQDTTIWPVPVSPSDPVRGASSALVTLVLFSDFQCPFCKTIEGTLQVLEHKYGKDLRIVWKDYPLPFHEQAVPAAVLARVALAKKGTAGFWRAHQALFEHQDELGEGALKAIAKGLGLAWADVQKARIDGRFNDVFGESERLAKALKVNGTPCSFVNGLRVAGAVPAEQLAAVIDQQLAKARAAAASNP